MTAIARIVKEPPTDGTTVYICGREDGRMVSLGDITLMEDGGAVVMNDWSGHLEFFDTHADALRYVRGRVCEDPVYAIV